jgi:hypothetical protein
LQQLNDGKTRDTGQQIQAGVHHMNMSTYMSKYMYIGAWAYEKIIYLHAVEALEVL